MAVDGRDGRRRGKLAPNNRISGGKTLSRHIPKESNRLNIALRNTANAVGNLKGNLKGSDLRRFFKKITYRKGRQAAITATARSIAVILWHMLTKKEPYKPKTQYVFLDEKRRAIARLRNKMSKFGIYPDEIGVFTKSEYKLAYEKRVNKNNDLDKR